MEGLPSPAPSTRRDQPARSVVVYGAYGHTGRFVTAELLRRGLVPVLSGRDPDRLAALAADSPDLDARPAAVDDPVALGRAFAGAAAVVNCAGPFADTAGPVAAAAVAGRAHYLDVTAEQSSVQALYRDADEGARAAGVAVVPAAAFYGGLPDLLATAATAGWEGADEITVGIGLDRWWPTAGTRTTGRRNTAPRLVVSDGRLAPAPLSPPARTWPFPDPLGPRQVVATSFSEIITMARHLPASTIRTYLDLAALEDLRDPATPPPRAVDDSGRSAQRFLVEVVARRGTEERRVAAGGRDIYAVSAPIVVEVAARLVDGRSAVVGVAAPGEVLDGEDGLAALSPHPLTITRR
ncbi:saccharopine dehydrogenase NADP-binding domain-containing protein [Pseudonocardia humida]|uniref:Saccharopine dehydrogenase NADP-binding domain-containing protein n=1 Tax=Pseudonocardia humida TaxID=2800819 RepID=A0ABT0ZV75_9PSEU|nr:saccharopine dehydrogenase NADP-binding domain-containing protein [Pseudonocardia humida]MCO1654558.1 saccharopine dehydrogenase NADP-binding domain-containing protein [Pseudonocardia humida]